MALKLNMNFILCLSILSMAMAKEFEDGQTNTQSDTQSEIQIEIPKEGLTDGRVKVKENLNLNVLNELKFSINIEVAEKIKTRRVENNGLEETNVNRKIFYKEILPPDGLMCLHFNSQNNITLYIKNEDDVKLFTLTLDIHGYEKFVDLSNSQIMHNLKIYHKEPYLNALLTLTNSSVKNDGFNFIKRFTSLFNNEYNYVVENYADRFRQAIYDYVFDFIDKFFVKHKPENSKKEL